MKTHPTPLKRSRRWLAVLPGLFLGAGLPAAVNFTVSPSAVSNTDLGYLSLQVTGLAAGESVVAQRFLDLNTNGVIDGADLLWEQFTLTDGQASVIGGVTNINVPGDTDPTAGRITAQVKFPTHEPGLEFVGRYAWRLSSPTAQFVPLTNTFQITNAAFAQGLTGVVRNNGTNVPYALVVVFQMGQDGPEWVAASTVANSTGNYSVGLPVGTYGAAAFKTNFLGSLAAAPVAVGSGATVTANLTVSNATQTLSGRVVGAANPAVGLPGLLMIARSGSAAAVGTSSDDGSFALRVVPGRWEVGANGAAALGYVELDEDNVIADTTTGGVSGFAMALPKATALFRGSVTDQLGQPLAGVYVFAGDDNDLYDASAFTDVNGNYVIGVIEGAWQVEVEASDQPLRTNYVYSTGLYTNLNAGQTARYNFTGIRTTQQIAGYLRDQGGNPIGDVAIHAYAEIGGQHYFTDIRTDAGGHYSLGVANGTWTVGVRTGPYSGSLPGIYLPPADQVVVINNNNGTANFTAVLAPYRISGTVRDDHSNPLPEVRVWASGTVGGSYYFQGVLTDASGHYSLGVLNGSWQVGVDCDGPLRGLCCPTNRFVTVLNADVVVNFTASGRLEITTPAALPDGYVGDFYQVFLDAEVCGSDAYWLAEALPPGLYLSWDGELYGAPEACGSNYFTVEVWDDAGSSTSKGFSLVVHPPAFGTVTLYYTAKLLGHLQTGPAGPVLDPTQGPYGAYLGVVQDPAGAVQEATCTLPDGGEKVFPLDCAALELQVLEAFPDAAVCDTAYPAGNYFFLISTPDDGQRAAVLHPPAAAYPDAPRLRNYTAVQAINPVGDFWVEWDPWPDGTPEDFVRLLVLETGAAPRLKSTYPQAILEEYYSADEEGGWIPAGWLEPSRSYLGVLQFLRVTSTDNTGHPNAMGLTLVSSQTVFPLGTTSFETPVLSAPEWLSPTEFGFVLTGQPDQNYTILKSTTLDSTNWSVLLVTNSFEPSVLIVDPSATNGSAFYRAVSGP